MSTTTDQPIGIPAKWWALREANADRMEAIAIEHFDPTSESANWIVTGWGHSIVQGADVRECREFLSCIASRQRIQRFHDLLTAERLMISVSWHGPEDESGRCRATFTPASS